MVRIVLVLVLLLVYYLFISIDAHTQITYIDKGCTGLDFNYTHGDPYEENLELVLIELTSKSSSLKFSNYTTGVGSNKVYGLFQCRNDIGLDVCNQCVKDATRNLVQKCHTIGEGIVWYNECMLRYANSNIFSTSETSPSAYFQSTENKLEFAPELAKAMNELIKKVSADKLHFGSTVTNLTLLEQLFSFAQCTPDINNSGCNNCLKSALSQLNQCCNTSIRATAFLPSCQLRYDVNPFLNDPLPSPPPGLTVDKDSEASNKTTLKPGLIGAIGGACAVGLLVLSVVVWICFCRKKPEEETISRTPTGSPKGYGNGTVRGGQESLGNTEFMEYDFATLKVATRVRGGQESLGNTEFMEYDFATLKVATRDFSTQNMLGEGGFGVVYKGTLVNGRQLAIKRLSGGSGQGNKEFMAEASLLAKLQHKNLVKLVGFCLEGEEKLLVYEFMTNAGLDGFLFDPRKRPLLNWVIRCKIIMGIARGLQYLHEDSRLTIIHRDLKPGNILLDKEMNPKIADFGLAKLFEGAQKYGNTFRVVGTQGYMAPEYMMTGEYSDKTDVYSFGIMLLEIVSGKKNKMFHQSPQKEDIANHAWRLWYEERSFDLTDPVLINNCSTNEVKRCIQIGLLCVQANARERPTMALVVFMLTGSVDLPVPSTPPMSTHQANMSMPNSGGQSSIIDQSSTKSVTMGVNETQDLYPKPR